MIKLALTGTDEQKQQAAGALRSHAVNADNKVAIADAGGIKLLVELARSGTAEQKEQAAGALRNLADPDVSTKLPPIMGEQLREAASTYKEHTGRGCDAF